jgi:phosphoglycerol transferase
VLLAVLGFGLYNQVTYAHVPPYELAGSYAQDRGFIQSLEGRLPDDAAVFQLPYRPFPESGRSVDLYENDLLRGFLHSEDLRWSFGATKGRPEDWVDDLGGKPTATVVDAAAAGGFAGILVDRLGYADRGQELERELSARLASTPLVSPSGRHSFFDLRDHGRRLAAAHSPADLAAFRTAVLEPLSFEESGFLPLERTLATGEWYAWADEPDAELRISNSADTARRAVLEATLDRVGGPPADVVVEVPSAAPQTLRTPAPLRLELSLPPGETVVRFSTDAPEITENRANDQRPHYFRLARLRATDFAFAGFTPAP